MYQNSWTERCYLYILPEVSWTKEINISQFNKLADKVKTSEIAIT